MSQYEILSLNLETLCRLKGGQLADDWNRLLSNLIADCNLRPEITKSRTLTLKLKLTPNGGTMGLESIDVEDQVMTSMPGFSHTTTAMQPRKVRGGQMMLAFDPNEPDQFSDADE